MKNNIVLVTNMITPYREYFYTKLYKQLKSKEISFHVLVSVDNEKGRNWYYNQYEQNYTYLLKGYKFYLRNNTYCINTGIKSFLKANNPEIVILAGGYNLPFVWQILFLKILFKYKVYFWSESHLHELRDYNHVTLLFREAIRKTIFKFFDGFLYSGKLSLEFIKKYAKANARLIFLPNLVDSQKFKQASCFIDDEINTFKNELCVDQKRKILICPARITKVKGIKKFLELFSYYTNKEYFQLIFVGDGDQKKELESYAEINKIDAKFLGYKEEPEIIKLYSIADVFLLPSLSDPNPLSCIEALWAGLPLLISKHVGNYPETVLENENGFVFDYDDPNTLFSSLDFYKDASESTLKNMSITSMRLAGTIFNPDIVIPKLVEELLE